MTMDVATLVTVMEDSPSVRPMLTNSILFYSIVAGSMLYGRVSREDRGQVSR
jgi:hypothetical protein